MKDISVIIPARNEHPQATFTLQCIWDQLEDSGLDWETILVDNLSEDRTSQYCVDRFWHAKGYHKVVKYEERGSCWGARNAGWQISEGRHLFYFDAHVVVDPQLFTLIFAQMNRRPSISIMYAPVVWMGDTRQHAAYGYNMGENCSHMASKFWGSWTRRKVSDEPYMVPMSGTAAMAVRRDHMDRIGGWPKDMQIYGGGEQWISLATWMLGGECWIHPQTYVYHLADRRGYANTNESHHFNKCLVAYALGEEKWWKIVLKRRLETSHVQYHAEFIRIAEEARVAAEPRREWLKENAKYSLDEVLETQPWQLSMVGVTG